MKTAILCAVCDNPTRFTLSYKVKLTTYDTLYSYTAEKKGGEHIVRVCRKCLKDMGYVVKKDKKVWKKNIVKPQI